MAVLINTDDITEGMPAPAGAHDMSLKWLQVDSFHPEALSYIPGRFLFQEISLHTRSAVAIPIHKSHGRLLSLGPPLTYYLAAGRALMIAECLSARQLIVQCTHIVSV